MYHAACTEEMRKAYRISDKNQKGRNPFKDLGVDGE
jgi:hypothetical protein